MPEDANPQKLTPNLRFPQFRRAPAWANQKLSDLTEVVRGGSPRPIDAFITTEPDGLNWLKIGDVPKESKYITSTEQKVLKSALSKTREIAPGDFILSNSMSFGRPYLSKIQTCIHDGWIAVTSLPHSFNRDFLYYSMMSEASQTYFESQAAGGGFRNLTVDIVKLLPVGMPSPAEQQKIADCLTSLDELIAAQGRKVEALAAHKRGLMQQLFPREGESVPQRRFPAFRDDAGWEDRELGPMTAKIGSGITPLGGDKNYKMSGRLFIRSQNVGWGRLLLDDVAFIDEETHKSFDGTELAELDVLLNITGASIGRSAIADSRIAGGNVNQHVCIIRVKRDEVNPLLLNQFLISERGQKQIDSFQAGGNRQGLNFGQIRSFMIPLPPTQGEQHRIANCLSTLDTQIAAASNKLATLKTHKQGLMQQLFPTPPNSLSPRPAAGRGAGGEGQCASGRGAGGEGQCASGRGAGGEGQCAAGSETE